MSDKFDPRSQKDEMLHILLAGGQARALFCNTSALTQEASNVHNASPVATAAFGRLLSGTATLGIMMKDPQSTVTVSINGGGPMGVLVAVAKGGEVKVTCDDPTVQMPLKENGKLNVSGAVGSKGLMSVVKDIGIGEPYIGQTELVTGEIGEDFAMYFTASEQQPSLTALGVLLAGEQVLSAGGILIQPLPGCTEEVLADLELRSPMFYDISREMTYAPMEQLVNDWFQGMDPQIIGRSPLMYRCSCCRERMERALVSLGRNELDSIIADDDGAELCCHFCHSRYQFSTLDLTELLKKATRD